MYRSLTCSVPYSALESRYHQPTIAGGNFGTGPVRLATGLTRISDETRSFMAFFLTPRAGSAPWRDCYSYKIRHKRNPHILLSTAFRFNEEHCMTAASCTSMVTTAHAATFSVPTTLAKLTVRSATTCRCSGTLIAWQDAREAAARARRGHRRGQKQNVVWHLMMQRSVY